MCAALRALIQKPPRRLNTRATTCPARCTVVGCFACVGMQSWSVVHLPQRVADDADAERRRQNTLQHTLSTPTSLAPFAPSLCVACCAPTHPHHIPYTQPTLAPPTHSLAHTHPPPLSRRTNHDETRAPLRRSPRTSTRQRARSAHPSRPIVSLVPVRPAPPSWPCFRPGPRASSSSSSLSHLSPSTVVVTPSAW